jgi:hypothetical protein
MCISKLSLGHSVNILKGFNMTNFPNLDSHKWNAYFNAAQAMTEHGGGFAGAIAEAYYKADKGNKAKLESAFQDLFFSFMSDYDRAWFGK